MKYGLLPKDLGVHEVQCDEMMFYQYLPIKFPNETNPVYEDRLKCFDKLIGVICCDFVGVFGLDKYMKSFIYITAKRQFQTVGCSFNRPGYHSDGFMTDDINYLWSDNNPTVFNKSNFILSQDDTKSLAEMELQAVKENEVTFLKKSLLRLDQYNIHKVSDVREMGMRTFLKVSFSTDRYDLKGNSHNYLINYNWMMRDRGDSRNMPQLAIHQP